MRIMGFVFLSRYQMKDCKCMGQKTHKSESRQKMKMKKKFLGKKNLYVVKIKVIPV